MKFLTKLISLLVVVAIFASALCVNVSATAAPSICNTGTRHVLCTSLSDMAESYYTAGYDYDTVSAKSASDMLTTLRKLMSDTHTHKTSYTDCRDLPKYTDSQANDEKVVLLYSSVSVTQANWTTGNNNGWNREHVWPKSLGGFGNNDAPGCDLHHVRPADTVINNNRGDKKYGNVQNGTQSTGTGPVAGIVGGHYAGNYFEPLDNVKGDVARICLYVYVRYGAEYAKSNDITNVFESVDVLLDWCEIDPVDEWEMSRNDVVSTLQGNRNVFIDYPEYAWLLFGEEIPADMATPTSDSRQSVGDKNEDEDKDDDQNPTDPQPTPEPDNSETTAPETNVPETNAPESESATVNTESESKANESESITDKDSNETVKEVDFGCGSTVAISAICVVGIVGIAAIVKKKED